MKFKSKQLITLVYRFWDFSYTFSETEFENVKYFLKVFKINPIKYYLLQVQFIKTVFLYHHFSIFIF